MPNTIPAAGEAMPKDILPSIERYLAAERVLNETKTPIEGTPVGAEFEAAIESIMEGKLEAITFHGAMKALRLAQTEASNTDGGGSMVEPLLSGAMAYFNRLDARNITADRSVAETILGYDIASVTGHGRMAVYDAMSTIITCIDGILCQPRCIGVSGHLNQAGEFLDSFQIFASLARDRIVEAAAAARPDDHTEWDARDELLMLDRVSTIYRDLKEVGEFALELHAQRAEHFGEKRP